MRTIRYKLAWQKNVSSVSGHFRIQAIGRNVYEYSSFFKIAITFASFWERTDPRHKI